MEKLKEVLQQENKKSFLDIGTGNGNFIHFIKSVYDGFDSFVGIDLFERAIEMANKQNEDERIEFLVMDALDMSFEDNTFDCVCLSNSLHHLSDIPGIFNEMKRVLKDDGIIIVSEMVSNDLDNMQLSHLKLHHFSAKIDRLIGDTHYDTFTETEILDKLKNNAELSLKKEWNLDVPRRSENTKEELDYIVNIMDRVMTRAPEEHLSELKLEAEDIKKYILENGYDGATTKVVVLGK